MAYAGSRPPRSPGCLTPCSDLGCPRPGTQGLPQRPSDRDQNDHPLRVRGRRTPMECSVELLATIILEWSALLASSTPPADDPALRRVEAAPGDRRGWL
ncbi:hypothetical protein NKH18_15240 [Streptomyces sp. M10(2022)]